MRSTFQEPPTEQIVAVPVNTEKKKNEVINMFPTYVSLSYSVIHPLVGLYAIFMYSVFYKYLGFVIAAAYYVYSTADLYYKRLRNGYLSSEDWLSVAHHVVTLFALSHFWWDLDFLNLMFTVAITSNIFLYIAYINEKKKLWFGKTRLVILTIETIVYILCREILGVFFMWQYYEQISMTLFMAVLLVFVVSTWWSYKLIKGLYKERAKYYADTRKKAF